jgi:hypothetical protein
MRSYVPVAFAALALFSSILVRAQDASTPAAPAANQAPADATPAAQAAPPHVVISASAPQAAKQVCHKEYRVGSNFPVTVCETPENPLADAERREHLREIQDQIRQSTNSMKPPG